MFDVSSDDTYFNVQHWVKTVKQVTATVDQHIIIFLFFSF